MISSWNAFTSVELLSRVFSLRTQFLVSTASESDFLLPFLSDQQTVTLRFVTPDARALSDLEACLTQHTNDLSCSIQHVAPSSIQGQPVVVSNTHGELSLSQTVRGCKSSVVAMKQEGKMEPENTLFSSTPLVEPAPVNDGKKMGDSTVKETPDVTVVKETPDVTVVKETQDSPLDPTPLLKESKPLKCSSHITPREATSPLHRSASIDALSSLHSTPKKPAKPAKPATEEKKAEVLHKPQVKEAKQQSKPEKSLTPVKQSKKPAEVPVPKAMSKTVATQMAGLSRRKGLSFLSQLMEEEKMPVRKEEEKMSVRKEEKMSVKKEEEKMPVKKDKEYRRKWQMPSKPEEEKEEEKEKEDKKEKEKEEPEIVEIEGEKAILPRKRSARKPQQKRAAPQVHTAGRKKARVNTPPPPIETKTVTEVDSDFSSSSEDIDTTHMMDTIKSLLSTPKVRMQSTESTPSSNASESDDEDPGLLAMQQMMTGEESREG